MEAATPWAAGRPTSGHSAAAAASRTPQPPTDTGTSIASRASGTAVSQAMGGSGVPTAQAHSAKAAM